LGMEAPTMGDTNHKESILEKNLSWKEY